MSKQNKSNQNAATDPENTVLVQAETNTNPENENKKQEVQSDENQNVSESGNSGGQTESVTDTNMDSKSEAEPTGKEGIETGGEIAGGDLDEESEFDKLDPAMQKAVAGAALEAINKALKTSDVPSEPKEKTAQRERIATEVFAKNHRRSVLYFTSDMIPFFEKTDAIKHIKGLDDKTIVTVNKE